MNWNSKQGEFTPVKSDRVKQLKDKVNVLILAEGYTVAIIAEQLGISKSRVYELLK